MDYSQSAFLIIESYPVIRKKLLIIIIIIIIIIIYLTRVNPSAEAVTNGCPGRQKVNN